MPIHLPITTRLTRGLIRGFVRFYYARLEFTGRERVPAQGPVLFVANHANSLMDPVIIGLAGQRPVHFLAKAPLFEVPVFGSLMRAFGMVPAYRGSDDRAQVKRNAESLGAAAAFLADGDAVGIFPEGKSHDALKVDTVRSGAARIAMQAVELGAKDLKIVPVGINYQRKEQFRSAVWVRVGEPISLADWLQAHPAEDKHSLRALTEEIDRRLQQVVIHLNDEKLEPLLDDLEMLVPLAHPFKSDPVAGLRQRKQIADAMNWFLATNRAQAEETAAAIQAYRAKVEAAGLTMRTLMLRRRGLLVTGQMLWRAGKLLLGEIPAFLGAMHHLVPFLAGRLIARWVNPPGRMTVALTRLGVGVPLYAAWYALVWHWAAHYFLPWVAWTWTVLMPFAGVYALSHARKLKELGVQLWHEVTASLRRGELAALRRENRELRRRLAVLAADYIRSQEAIAEAPSISWRWLARRIFAWTAAGAGVLLLAAWVRVTIRNQILPELRETSPNLAGLPPETLRHDLQADETVLVNVIHGLNKLEQDSLQLQQEFASGQRSFYRQADDDLIRQSLFRYLNFRTELLRLIWQYQNYEPLRDERLKDEAFLVCMTSGLTLYHYSYQFVTEFGVSPETIKKMNEPEPRWGIPANLYDTVRDNLRNPNHRKMIIGALSQYESMKPAFARLSLNETEPYATFHSAIAQSIAATRTSVGPSPEADISVVLQEAGSLGKDAVYRGQSAISTWLGDTRIRQPRHGKALVQPAQLDALRAKVKPGDILLERQNWYLSRAFMPGYWAHAALYVGTPDDLKRLGLDRLPEVAPHWSEVLAHAKESHPQIVLEAVPQGVRVTTLDHCLGVADSAAVLRPHLPEAQIHNAIAQAFSHLGKPYDFEFDFFSTDKLVCTELVYRSYEGPIHFTLVDVLGRKTLPPTELVHKFAEERGRPNAELEFVAFLDGDESLGHANFSNETELAKSINRPSLTWLQTTTR